ncbi:zinc-binding alcohol dehydrogenase family protein [Amycolatopsis endophytica]|uniref:L-gulonate 5-dehydrogenase n=1 Tax=Amycolatopsis endophytica TaxID=860233 RepID=A0A853AW80_9PSEU|nr:alcohol dehydrogenase catalytic domain-containing protein [Amycolatopsis endophytica]NYI86905.1 L-gulonate 5-dehydrogenase [Amycolatopsis endophytica]
MKVARTLARERVEIQDAPDPEPAPGEALVRVHTVTLCGTDLHIWEDDYATELPIVQGHEIAGIVASAPGFAPGDRVAVSPMRFCGECYACGIGRVNACRDSSCLGCYTDGALAELIAVPVTDLHRIPDGMPTGIAALAEPASIAMQAVLRGRPVRGERALVLGCGPIGLLATLHLTSLGVEVIAADTAPERAAFARRFGAVAGVDPGELTVEPSLVIEATGAPAAFTTAVDVVATAGRVVLVGISDRPVTVSMRTVPVKDIDLLGSRNSQRRLGEALELLDAHPEAAEALVTHRVPFARVGDAFPLLRSRNELVGKVAVEVSC